VHQKTSDSISIYIESKVFASFFQRFPKLTDAVMLAFEKRQHGSAGTAHRAEPR